MVNYGVSRACATCKQKRKKCDVTHPSCKRCNRAKLVCPGYQNEADLTFRRYCGNNAQDSSRKSIQSSESQLRRPILYPVGLQHAFNESEIEQGALAAFLEDYCIISQNKSLSRGYLDDLGYLLAHAEQSSNIAQAAKIAAFATLGNKIGDSNLIQEANSAYGNLLRSFQVTMSNAATSKTTESLTTAVLLGLYEIISATKNHPGEHGTHFQGVSAILSCENSPFSRHPAIQLVEEANSPLVRSAVGGPLIWPYDLCILCPTKKTPSLQSLDALLLRFSPLFRQGHLLNTNLSTPKKELRQFREYAMTIDEEFALWPARQPEEWRPKVLGFVTQREKRGLLSGTTSAPGRIDIYFDLYVSAVWNCYRKCRLLLLECIYTCSKRLQDDESEESLSSSQCRILKEAKELSESIAASIPFHLIRNPEVFLVPQQQTSSIDHENIVPNKSVGGLLLMHPISAVSELSIVPEHMREMFKEYLAWIGRFMGLGHAGLLADRSFSFPREFVVDGHILIWAGTLIARERGAHEDKRDGKIME